MRPDSSRPNKDQSGRFAHPVDSAAQPAAAHARIEERIAMAPTRFVMCTGTWWSAPGARARPSYTHGANRPMA